MQFGIDRLLNEPTLQSKLKSQRIALVAHPASMTADMQHSIDALFAKTKLNITAAFGPQHGMRGDKQDNMIESPDYVDPTHQIPVFSLYGKVRRPTAEMMQLFDVLLFDIQDLGCRIYTYVTTLLYLLEACVEHKKTIWILDRPNPAGRAIEGSLLEDGWQSFVGAGEIIMRHGLTMGEMAQWFVANHGIDVELEVVKMHGYDLDQSPGFGWPLHQRAWVNPSPNAASLNMARCYAGTVMIEGTRLSEGRGTTIPLEVIGASDIDVAAILKRMTHFAPQWLHGTHLRPCFFEPTFHKHKAKLCQGLQIHTDTTDYQPNRFKPFRLTLLFLKALRLQYPDYDLWSDHDYEYVLDRKPFDVIHGSTWMRKWVDDTQSSAGDLDNRLTSDETQWQTSVEKHLLY